MSVLDYELVVIGSGPAGQKDAIAAAKAGKRVALVDRTLMIEGVSVHTGTTPSKTLGEAIFQLTGSTVKALYGKNVIGFPALLLRWVGRILPRYGLQLPNAGQGLQSGSLRRAKQAVEKCLIIKRLNAYQTKEMTCAGQGGLSIFSLAAVTATLRGPAAIVAAFDYVCCLDCGKKLPYSVLRMSIMRDEEVEEEHIRAWAAPRDTQGNSGKSAQPGKILVFPKRMPGSICLHPKLLSRL